MMVVKTLFSGSMFAVFYRRVGFKVLVLPDKISIISSTAEELGYYDELTLRESFEKKLHHVLYILADRMGRGKTEQFWFNEAWMLTGFNYEDFQSHNLNHTPHR